MVVLDQLAPKDVLAVMREFDSSKASVVNLLVTPEQFARAMVLEKQYKDLTHQHLRNMVNAVVFRDGADPLEFLNAIGDLDGGAEALAITTQLRAVGISADRCAEDCGLVHGRQDQHRRPHHPHHAAGRHQQGL